MDFDKRLQQRDVEVIEFINTVKVANRNQIKKALFKGVHDTVCMRRLKFLTDGSYLKRARYKQKNGNNGFVYYANDAKKPSKKLITHDLLVTDFYAEMLSTGIDIITFKPTYVLGPVIADAYVKYRGIDDKIRRVLLEVQRSGKLEDCVVKYKGIRNVIKDETKWGSMPTLVVMSDLGGPRPTLKSITTKYINTDLNTIRTVLF